MFIVEEGNFVMWRIKPDKIKELESEFKKRGVYGASSIATETKIPLPSLQRMLKGEWFRSSSNLRGLFTPLAVTLKERGEQSSENIRLRVDALISEYCDGKEYRDGKDPEQNNSGESAPPPPITPVTTNILTFSPFFPMDQCMEGIAQAKQVCFLSTWLVLSDSLLQPLLDRAIDDSVETRILLLDPASSHVALRGIDLISSQLAAMEDPADIKAAIREAKRSVHKNIMNSLDNISHRASRRQNGARLEVGVYDTTPSMTLLIMDGYVCQGCHRRDHKGSSLPHILYTRDAAPALYQADSNHFDAIWNSRTTYRYDIAAKKIVRNRPLSQEL